MAWRAVVGAYRQRRPGGFKAGSLIAGTVAGADSIDDMGVLRHGAMGTVFDPGYAPSTLGSFLRAFTLAMCLSELPVCASTAAVRSIRARAVRLRARAAAICCRRSRECCRTAMRTGYRGRRVFTLGTVTPATIWVSIQAAMSSGFRSWSLWCMYES